MIPLNKAVSATAGSGFDSARLLPVTYVMAGVILLVSIVLIFADIVAPVSIS